MSSHLCQLDGVPPHELWFQAHSSLLSWQNSYPWARPTVLRKTEVTILEDFFYLVKETWSINRWHVDRSKVVGDYIILARIIVADEQSQHMKTVVWCCFIQIWRKDCRSYFVFKFIFDSLSKSVHQLVTCCCPMHCHFIESIWVLCAFFCKLDDWFYNKAWVSIIISILLQTNST